MEGELRTGRCYSDPIANVSDSYWDGNSVRLGARAVSPFPRASEHCFVVVVVAAVVFLICGLYFFQD